MAPTFKLLLMKFMKFTSCFNPHLLARVQEFLATEGCNCKYIPPPAPKYGGIWEAALKSMKYHLPRILGAMLATNEELCTLLAEIEACLNSRHLFALSDDPFNQTY